ncbi:hypothetical protein P152DRAFT_275129 [Eremomyces bilateralis CBS 781.70]|uniref:UBX domain-containing protein 2 n=1 Tax=Eremomyces bilateralis CBS 781.70 TaxID=1392243 RepID=A0A6G1G976_9PEZI|nr:uncharacterized protein P152DRAFT_275129 [Eremomyces bilateralis CBS 781.70]KAF1814486.1 hypothetical protein P152DRAFT_275129 [Eremomyces bilateralis CBS 781.70]
MFHDDLQSGISLAIQQGKLVACFVSGKIYCFLACEDALHLTQLDEKDDSQRWEIEWLSHVEVHDLLSDRTVLLRICAGTQEESFLSAFCPVSSYPSLIIIRNGQLLDRIESENNFDDFLARIKKVFDAAPPTDSTLSRAVPDPSDQILSEATLPPSTSVPIPTDTPHDGPQGVASASPTQPRPEGEDSARPVALTNQPKVSKGKERAAATRPAAVEPHTPSSDQDARNDWVIQQRKRQQEARQERERILAAIEADKVERRRRRRREEQARSRESPAPNSISSPLLGTAGTSGRGTKPKSQPHEVPLQVRLPSGERIRKSFPSTGTITADVRPWIDVALRSDLTLPATAAVPAYTLTHIIPPKSYSLPVQLEERELRDSDLDLLPSATLIVVLVRGGANAYADAHTSGMSSCFDWAWRTTQGVAQGIGEAVSGSLAYASNLSGLGSATSDEGNPRGSSGIGLDGTNERRSTAADDRGEGGPTNTGTGVRIRTLADQRSPNEGETYYNGNQLSFESKNRDDEEG